jgi:hypothetical protein
MSASSGSFSRSSGLPNNPLVPKLSRRLRILKLRECPLEQLITSGAYARQGRIEPDVGRDADHVVLRASIVAGYAHARERDGEPAVSRSRASSSSCLAPGAQRARRRSPPASRNAACARRRPASASASSASNAGSSRTASNCGHAVSVTQGKYPRATARCK